ncbi:MAG: hypothetical protein TREMPRED_001658 [Tremellales sp. Tagirdzhanova-0007]|nr:MAG: hypothetical protein TREMPRED_001658 [Tremellales sp. Tagirdzhanova-0007]
MSRITPPLRSLCSTFLAPNGSTSRSYSRAKTKLEFRQRKKQRIADRAQAVIDAGTPDPVLGHINPGISSKRSTASTTPQTPTIQPWDDCRLQKTIIHPRTIWNLPVPNYASGETPRHFLPGLSESDKEMLFGAVPHVTSALKFNNEASPAVRDAGAAQVLEDQDKQSEMLMRILDLRNASRERINAVNRDRVVNEFGQGWNTGSSAVQAALFTTKIRGLNEHVLANPHDVHNKRSMTLLVHKRAKILKYLKRRSPDEYEQTLIEIGLDKRTVEGELLVKL